MSNHSGFHLAAALSCAAALAGCGGSGRNDSLTATAGVAAMAGTAGQTVTLSGCLESAPGTNRYLLRHVQYEPAAGDTPGTETVQFAGITPGAWVRLNGGQQDLESRLTKRVVIRGVVEDTGANTIGTAGTQGETLRSGDVSAASSDMSYAGKIRRESGRIARESMANGTAADIRVEEVVREAGTCK
jgi:hypothetical protein